jgi:hypothetical protein
MRRSSLASRPNSLVPCARRATSALRVRARCAAGRAVPTYRGRCSKLCAVYPPCQTLSAATLASAAIPRCGSYPTGPSTALHAALRCSRSTFPRPLRGPMSTARRTGQAGRTAASGREAASWTTPTSPSGRLDPTGSTTTRTIVQAAKLARRRKGGQTCRRSAGS